MANVSLYQTVGAKPLFLSQLKKCHLLLHYSVMLIYLPNVAISLFFPFPINVLPEHFCFKDLSREFMMWLFIITQCHCQKGGVSVGVKINGSSKPSGVMVTSEIWEDPRPILRYKTGLQNHKETHKNETWHFRICFYHIFLLDRRDGGRSQCCSRNL